MASHSGPPACARWKPMWPPRPWGLLSEAAVLIPEDPSRLCPFRTLPGRQRAEDFLWVHVDPARKPPKGTVGQASNSRDLGAWGKGDWRTQEPWTWGWCPQGLCPAVGQGATSPRWTWRKKTNATCCRLTRGGSLHTHTTE